jgi:7-carboxy-7-deazaguanine synthase
MTGETLLVSEIFGPTWQGEGPSAGQLAVFVRLGRCNLDCHWCDTAYTWDATRYDLDAELHPMSLAGVWRIVRGIDASLVVITGGEPLLQQQRITGLAQMCREDGRRIEIETNGTIVPRNSLLDLVDQFNVSPKLANSGIPARRRIKAAALTVLASSGRSVFKFVVRESADLQEITDLERKFALRPIWVMPEGDSAQQVLATAKLLATPVLSRGWNLTLRMQSLIWENARGR